MLLRILWSLVLFDFLGDTKVLAAVYGPKAGTKKNENPERASIEVIWKPKTGQSGKFSTHMIHLYILLYVESTYRTLGMYC